MECSAHANRRQIILWLMITQLCREGAYIFIPCDIPKTQFDCYAGAMLHFTHDLFSVFTIYKDGR